MKEREEVQEATMAEAEATDQLLVVVVDINPNQLLLARQPGALSQLLNCVLTLLNSHLMLEPRHRSGAPVTWDMSPATCSGLNIL